MVGQGRVCAQFPDLTVNEFLVAYLEYADGYYRKNGKPTKEPALLRLSYRFLRVLYGHTPAAEFGPMALKAVRQAMLKADLCAARSTAASAGSSGPSSGPSRTRSFPVGPSGVEDRRRAQGRPHEREGA